jgi:hypothetical protein
MKVNEDGIPFGDGLEIHTQNGSIYHIAKDGAMTCTKGKRAGLNVGKAQGSVYRGRGPIRIKEAVLGLSIEACRTRQRKIFVTTPVILIKQMNSPLEGKHA